MIAKTFSWQKTALAAAATALLGLSGAGAYALSLGRLTVQSALGEPLRAEIDVPEITAEEAASLKAGVALPEAFTAAGMEYNPVMSSLQATLQRKPDGRAYLRLSSDRTVNEPFVDLILEATWSQGRIVRDYTLLLDPPALDKAPVAPTLAQVPTPPVVNDAPPKVPPPAPAVPAQQASSMEPKVAAPRPTSTGSAQLTVKKGDTASKIANNIRPSGVSLDQMLVAMLRSNPEAFINDNLNRIRAGAILNVPEAELAQSVSPAEADKLVVAHSKDFNDFRRSLATNAPAAAVAAADRKASGTVEAKVDDKKPASTTPDKLTLSKGSVVPGKVDEATIAKEREARDAAARTAEISKNIAELSKIGSATAPAAAKAATASPSAPGPGIAAKLTTAASAPEAAAAPQAAASMPAKPMVTAVSLPEEPSLLDTLLEDPLVPAGAAALIALLGGYAALRIRQRKQGAGSQVDSTFLESRLQPESFFGASGGQHVDTSQHDASTTLTTEYPTSQLDTADDVDPVAEADVYLAYGRDIQAEEILKEALRTHPERLAIHTKLLEIFHKRQDIRSYENAAAQAYTLTSADSPDWARICEMGLSIDPNNPLYQPGGAPSTGGEAPETSDSTDVGNAILPPSAPAEQPTTSTSEVDMDLDFSSDDEPSPTVSDASDDTPPAEPEPEPAPKDNALDMDLDLSEEPALNPTAQPPVLSMPDISLSLDDLEAPTPPQLPDLNFEPTQTAEPASPASAPENTDSGMLEFDLSALSMELEPHADATADALTEAPETLNQDPLETKLALADEFISIGDEDGARAVIEEVIAEATGDLRAKAERILATLS